MTEESSRMCPMCWVRGLELYREPSLYKCPQCGPIWKDTPFGLLKVSHVLLETTNMTLGGCND